MIGLPQSVVSDIVVFTLIFSIVYAVLSRSKFFYKSDIPALIAVAVGLIAMLSQLFVSFTMLFLPDVLALGIFIFMAVFLFSTAMVPHENIAAYLKRSSLIPVLVIFVVFIFGIIAFGTAASVVGGTAPMTSSNQSVEPVSSSSSSGSSSFSSSSGPSMRISFGDITSQYIISIFTAPSVLSLILTLGAMATGVFFMTRDTRKA